MLILTLILPLFLNLKNASIIMEFDSVVISHTRGIKTYRHFKFKVLNESGRDKYGDIKVRYHKNSQNFLIKHVWTILPDGKKVKPEKDAIMDVGTPEVAEAPGYTDALFKVVSFPSVAPGVEIEYAYEISGKEGENEPLFGTFVFPFSEPVKEKVLIIKEPIKQKLFYRTFNGNLDVKVETTGTKKIYIFRATELQKIENEPFMPSLREIGLRVDFSEFESPDSMAMWLYKKFKDKIEVTPEIKKLADSLKAETPENSFYSALSYVQEKIRNINLYLWDAGFEPHRASWVLKKKYGDPRDKAVLLCSILKAMGIKAMPVLVNIKKPFYSTMGFLSSILENSGSFIPTPTNFTDMLVMAEINGKKYFGSPMDHYSDYTWLPSRYQNRPSFTFSTGKAIYFNLPVKKPDESVNNIELTGEIDTAGNLIGCIKGKLTGYYAEKFRKYFKEKKTREQKILIESYLSGLSQKVEIDSFSFKNLKNRKQSPYFEIYFKAMNFVVINGSQGKFILPLPFQLRRFATLKRRKYPLLVGAPRETNFKVNLKFSRKLEPVILPKSISLISPNNSLSSKVSFDGKTLTYEINYRILKEVISPEDYRKFKRIENRLFGIPGRTFVFNGF